MNGTNQNQGQSSAANIPPIHRGAQRRDETSRPDPQKLAAETQQLGSIISDNRAKLDQGWQELRQLEQTLAELDAKLKSKEPAISKAA